MKIFFDDSVSNWPIRDLGLDVAYFFKPGFNKKLINKFIVLGIFFVEVHDLRKFMKNKDFDLLIRNSNNSTHYDMVPTLLYDNDYTTQKEYLITYACNNCNNICEKSIILNKNLKITKYCSQECLLQHNQKLNEFSKINVTYLDPIVFKEH
jgi:hypothetical protein